MAQKRSMISPKTGKFTRSRKRFKRRTKQRGFVLGPKALQQAAAQRWRIFVDGSG